MRLEPSLDLHGVTTQEARARVESLVDRAYFRGMDEVQVIHGKGSGKLRAAVREALRGHPMVAGLDGSDPGLTRIRLAR